MMKRRKGLLALFSGFALVPAVAFANVYPTNLSQDANSLNTQLMQTVNLGYILNEDANTSVFLDILDSSNTVVRTFTLGAQTKGTHNVVWDGKNNLNQNVAYGDYSFRVTASTSGFSDWTQISTDNNLNSFYSPRGVSVNTDSSSKSYGRIYVSESAGGTTGAGRPTQDGLYLLNSDGSDALGQGNTAKNGGVAWGTTNSPYRVEVGPDGRVYVGDWSDSHSGLWVGDEDFSSATEALDSTGRDANGLNATHGSISGFMIEGTGANRKIYTIDEDMVDGGPAGRLGSVWRYDIGNNATFSGPPSSVFYDDGISNKIQNYYNDVVRAPDQTIWISQDRSGSAETLTSLMQVSSDGSTILWTSVPALGANSNSDPLRRTRGLAIYAPGNIMALATYDTGKVIIFDLTTKSILTTVSMGGSGTSANRDVAFDAVGNLYVVNNSVERMRIFSPGGANSSFTGSLAPLGAISVVPEPTALLALGSSLIGFAGLVVRKRR